MEEQIKQLVEKVSELYMRYGIRSVTMDDVARHLGISKKTLYGYVKDKKELVELSVEYHLNGHIKAEKELIQQKLSALDELLEGYRFAGEILKKTNPSYQYDLQKYYPHLCENFNRFKRENLFNIIRKNLLKGIEEGVYRKEINVDIIAKMHAFRHFKSDDFNQEDLELFMNKDAFKEIFLYHIHAILNDKGREILKQKKFFDQD